MSFNRTTKQMDERIVLRCGFRLIIFQYNHRKASGGFLWKWPMLWCVHCVYMEIPCNHWRMCVNIRFEVNWCDYMQINECVVRHHVRLVRNGLNCCATLYATVSPVSTWSISGAIVCHRNCISQQKKWKGEEWRFYKFLPKALHAHFIVFSALIDNWY